MKPNLCCYHNHCIDGYAAAWVVGHALGFDQVEFVPIGHGEEFPMTMKGRDVYIVDFLPNSPADLSKDTLKQMASAKSVTILDHHASAYENWKDVPLLDHWTYRYEPELSGVGVAWRHMFGSANPAMYVPLQLIQDRDLWKFELEMSREFHAVAVSEGLLLNTPTEDDWLSRMVDQGETEVSRFAFNVQILTQGRAILRDQKNFLHTLLKRARLIDVCGYEVPICQVPYDLRSDAGYWLSLKYPFSITYDDMWSEGLRRYSVRSNKKTGIDVTKIAEAFGGGGHKNAAAFTTPVDERLLFWLPPSNRMFQRKLDLEI